MTIYHKIQNNSPKTKSQSSNSISPFPSLDREGKKLAMIKDIVLGLLYLLLFLCACVSTAQLVPPEMSGEYTVGSIGADYETIGEAVTAYRSSTITGDVTFLLQAETFNESVDLEDISNSEFHFTIKGMDREASIINTVGTGGLLIDDGNTAGIVVEDSRHITLENFTLIGGSLTNAVRFFDTDSSSLKHINFEGADDNRSLSLESVSQFTVEDCDFTAFSNIALHVQGSDSVFIDSNQFSNFHENGIFRGTAGFGTNRLFIRNNVMQSDFATDRAVNMTSGGYFEISGNTIHGSVFAELITGEFEAIVKNNRIFGGDKRAFEVFSNNGGAGYLSVYNNVFHSETDLGVRIDQLAFPSIGFINNTVVNGGNPGGSYNFIAAENVLSDRTLTYELSIVNNIFKGVGTSAFHPFFQSTDSELLVDHNLFYADVPETISNDYLAIDGVVLTADTYTLAEWQALFSGLFDQNSQSFEPAFVSADDFHITHGMDYRFGTYIDTLDTDIDGDIRMEGSVDVGADQYVCQESLSSFEVTVFDQYVWEGDVYSESGSFTNDYINNVGCDSTATLILKILELTSDNFIPVDENTEGSFYTITTNEAVTFSLGTEKEEEWFSLDGAQLSFVNPPDFEVPFNEGGDNDYFIDIIATDAAGNTSSIELIISVVDVDEIVLATEDANHSIAFYPNPVADYVFFTSRAELDVRVMTLDGKLLIDQKVRVSMDLSQLDPGSYLLEITEDNQRVSKRIIKTH